MKDEAREVVGELVADLRRHETQARELLAKVPTDADETNVRSHVRLRAKAHSYAHAAELVEDGGLRLPAPMDEWGLFLAMLVNLPAYLSRNHELEHVRFSAMGDQIVVHFKTGIAFESVSVPLDQIRKLGPNAAITEAVRRWKER